MDLNIVAVGDIYLNRKNPEEVFSKVKPVFDEADIVIANLEAPITNEESARPFKTGSTLKSGPEMVSGLVYAGVDFVSLANTHAMDYGANGLLETIKILNENGITHTGAGRDIEEATEPVVLERKGIKVVFVSFDATPWTYWGRAKEGIPGVNNIGISPLFETPHIDKYSLKNATEQISTAASMGDLVIASFHWGEAPFETVAVHQRALGRRAVDFGAHLILGHHPHTLQGIEICKGSVICYSLGNLVFDLDPNVRSLYGWGEETVILKCSASRDRVKASLIPALVPYDKNKIEVVRASEGRGRDIAEKLSELSKPFKTTLSIRGDEIMIHLP